MRIFLYQVSCSKTRNGRTSRDKSSPQTSGDEENDKTWVSQDNCSVHVPASFRRALCLSSGYVLSHRGRAERCQSESVWSRVWHHSPLTLHFRSHRWKISVSVWCASHLPGRLPGGRIQLHLLWTSAVGGQHNHVSCPLLRHQVSGRGWSCCYLDLQPVYPDGEVPWQEGLYQGLVRRLF